MRALRRTAIQKLSGEITRTWMDDRADELQRRSYRTFYRIVWPPPIRIVRDIKTVAR
jgi:hypothetical protein